MEIRNVFDKVIGERFLNLFEFLGLGESIELSKVLEMEENLIPLDIFCSSLRNCALNIVWK